MIFNPQNSVKIESTMKFFSLELECNLMGLKIEDKERKMKNERCSELMEKIMISRALKIDS